MQPCVSPSLLKSVPMTSASTLNLSSRPVALVTAPSGGNIFMRRVLEQLSGIMTGSVYRADSHVRREGFLAEGVFDSTVIAAATHAFTATSSVWKRLSCKNVKKVIIILRSPYDVVRSEFSRCVQQSIKDHGLQSPQLQCKGRRY